MSNQSSFDRSLKLMSFLFQCKKDMSSPVVRDRCPRKTMERQVLKYFSCHSNTDWASSRFNFLSFFGLAKFHQDLRGFPLLYGCGLCSLVSSSSYSSYFGADLDHFFSSFREDSLSFFFFFSLSHFLPFGSLRGLSHSVSSALLFVVAEIVLRFPCEWPFQCFFVRTWDFDSSWSLMND